MQSTTTIETPRLLLKGISPAFIQSLFITLNKQQIISFFAFEDEAAYNHMETMYLKGIESYSISLYYFLLIDKATNTTMGDCGFHTWNTRHRHAEIFYALRKDEYKRKGFVSEALPFVLAFGFAEMGLHRVQGRTIDANIPSVKLMLKNGFTREAIIREDYYINGKNESSVQFSLLKQEFKN